MVSNLVVAPRELSEVIILQEEVPSACDLCSNPILIEKTLAHSELNGSQAETMH